MNTTAERLPDLTREDFETAFAGLMLDCDLDPEIAWHREQFMGEGMARLIDNGNKLESGDYASVPRAIDVLGTARVVVEVEKTHGKDSPQYAMAYNGLFKDSIRLDGESKSKRTAKYFRPTFQELDPLTGDYLSDGYSTRAIVESGLSPMADPEDQEIRIYDYAGKRTSALIGNSHLGQEGVTLRAVKQIPDFAIRDHELDKKSTSGGFVAEVKKLFIEDETFVDGGLKLEAVALPGTYATEDVINEVLLERGATARYHSKLELTAKRFVSTDEKGIMGFVAAIDKKASEKSGKLIFMGEEVDEAHPRDYQLVIDAAKAEELSQESTANSIADFLIDKVKQDIDSGTAGEQLDEYLKQLNFKAALNDPELARAIFNDETADAIREIQAVASQGGNVDGLIRQAYKEAPAILYCGAGSCGILAVARGSLQEQRATKQGLLGEIMYFSSMTCPDCHTHSVYGDIKGSKACLNPDCKKEADIK